MNTHLRALLIVGGLALLIGAGVFYYQAQNKAAESVLQTGKVKILPKESLPDFEIENLNGKKIKLSDYRDKIVILNFWASWCGPCVEEMPSLIKLMKEFPQDVQLLAVSGDSNMDDIQSFIKSFPELKTQSNIELVWDKDKRIAQLYQIYRLPESFVLKKNLVMEKKISGTIDWYTEDARSYMNQLIHPATTEGTPMDEQAPEHLPESMQAPQPSEVPPEHGDIDTD